MRTSRRNHRGCLLLVCHGNVTSIRSASWSRLVFSYSTEVTQLQRAKVSVPSFYNELVSPVRDTWLLSEPTGSEKWKFQAKSQTSKQSWHGVIPKPTTWLCAGSNPLIGYWLTFSNEWHCVCSYEEEKKKTEIQTPRREYELKRSDFFKFPLCGWGDSQ